MLKRLGRSSCPLIAMMLAGCAADPPPFRPRDLQRDELDTAKQVPVRERLPLPTTLRSEYLPTTGPAAQTPVPRPATGPAIGTEPTVKMTLQEAVQRAVANSLDVKVQGYSPAIEATRVVEAEARFDPTFFTTAQYENRGDTSAHGSPDFLANINATEGDSWTLRSGVRQVMPSGGEAEVRYQTSRVFNEAAGFNPENTAWENELVFQVTQPLLRDFGADVNRARITIARNNQRISLLDFREALEQTITEVERAYWELVQSLREVRIQERLLDDTISTTDLLFKRRGQDVTRVQLSQANASLETRRAGLVRARARVRDLSDQLKRLMNDPDMPVTGAALILPANEPIEDPIRFSLEDQIATGLENRFELGQQQLRIDSSYIAMNVAKNNLLPQLGLAAQVGLTGASGNDSFGDAFEDQVEYDDNISFALGLQLEVPIGNRAARAIFRRSQFQRQQAVTEYRRLIDVVAFDVKTALREVETRWEEMVATRQARFASADALYAIRQREEANEPLTPEFVDRKLNLQERLAESERAEAAAVSGYNIAIARLEQAKGTLLRYNNVVMEEDGDRASAR